MVKHVFISVVLSCVMPPVANAQWTPVHASQTETITVVNANSTSHTMTKAGTYDRDSSGDELTKMVVVGSQNVSEAHLNNSQGEYVLDSRKKIAHMVFARNAPREAPEVRTSGAIGQQIVNERDCYIFPARLIEKSGQSKRIGSVWVDETIHLIVKQDITTPSGDGGATHLIMDRTQIVTDKEPDPSLFKVPTGFTVVKVPNAEQSYSR